MRRNYYTTVLLAVLVAGGLWRLDASRTAPSVGVPAPAVTPTLAFGTAARTVPSPVPTPVMPPGGRISPGGALAGVANGPADPHDLRDDAAREQWSAEVRDAETQARRAADSLAAKAGIPARGEVSGDTYEFAAVRGGHVYVRTTHNVNAAISTAAAAVRQTPPYGLDGAGLTVGVWDAGSVRATHQEFTGRLTLRNNVGAQSHSTHVGGTIAASGVDSSAKGMAPAVRLDSYDWNFDSSEMLAAAMATSGQSGKLPLSNHSYGFQSGWFGATWYGTWGARESDGFGIYDFYAAEQDDICYRAPYYLPFKAVGNDRSDGPPSAGQTFTYFDADGAHTKAYDPGTDPPGDFWDGGGYDTISFEANAKNTMSIGAINDAVFNGTRSLAAATMTSFSSWGPADDGRIKPDLVANGTSLYSSTSASDSSYGLSGGTSMATPNAVGSAALVVQHHKARMNGKYPRASTLKGLLIHTADDLGAPGPDYQNGWGLINTLAAVQQIDAHVAHSNALRLVEATLNATQPTNVFHFIWDQTSPIKATICWTDPAGTPHSGLDNRTPVLVHDLDLRVIAPDGTVFFPFVLSATNPAAPAVTGDNNLDNVEQVFVAAPPAPGEYTIRVSVDGFLTAPAQDYALFVSGATEPPVIEHTPLQNTTNAATPYEVTARITAEAPLDPQNLWLFWNTSGAAAPFSSNRLVQVGADVYRAEIPAHPIGTTLNYYLEAQTTTGLMRRSPESAPTATHAFAVVESFVLLVSGQPNKVPGVQPNYGVSSFPSGVTVQARAPLYSPPLNGVRDTCVGWIGWGGLPAASGTSNAVDFSIREDSALFWQWRKAYALTQTSSIAGLITAETWWVEGTTGTTVQAQTSTVSNGTNYMFVAWVVDGMRQPSGDARAENPAAAVVMGAPHQAEARYVPATQDADADGVADWWELYYFGDTGASLNVDLDGDGFSNLKEYQDLTDPRDAASMPQPPSIAHTPLAPLQGLPAPWTLSANVTDNNAVAEVRLEWRRNGGGWQSTTALTGVTEGSYTSSIPAPGVTGDTFQYRLVARDPAGLQSVNGPYTFAVAYPIATLTPTTFGLIKLPAATTARRILSVGNLGHAPLEWNAQTIPVGLQDNGEGGTNGWTHGGTLDVWHVASWRAYSGSNAWYFGRDTSRQYPDSAKAWLLSPSVYLAAGAQFSFRQWLSTEALKDAQHAWDGAVVEISTNAGATFTQITPEGGYPYVIFGHPASAFPGNTPCFAGTGGWQQVTFNLGSYTGQTVRLRLLFGADGFVVNEGWYVDDLTVTPYGGATDWLSLSTSNGVVEALGSQPSQAIVSTVPLQPAETRQAVILLTGNDPFYPEKVLSVALHSLEREILVAISGEGTVTPPGPVRLNVGESTNFWIAAAPYSHLADLRTNGVTVGGPFELTTTNFVWANIGFEGEGELRAIFALNTTSNGVTEKWLAAYGLTNSYETESTADQDGDRMSAWQEYIAGTDPTNHLSRLAFDAITPVTTNLELSPEGDPIVAAVLAEVLEWTSASGRTYTVSRATNLFDGFQPLVPSQPATPPLNRYTTTDTNAPRAFYRLDVQWMP